MKLFKNVKKKKTPLIVLCAVVVCVLSAIFVANVIASEDDEYVINCPEEYAERYITYIDTFEQLVDLANEVNSGENDYKGMTVALNDDIEAKTKLDSYKSGFVPIGTKEHPFRGTFDGCGYTVTLTLKTDSTYGPNVKDCVGLFGYVENAFIRNVTVSGTLKSTGKTGAIAVYAVSSEITNCICSTSVLSGKNVGGIAATISGTEEKPCVIANCLNCCKSFSTTFSYAGGFGCIVGRMEDEYTFVYNCLSLKDLTTRSIGGIAGFAAGEDPIKRIENCYYLASKDTVNGVCGKEDLNNYVVAIDSERANTPDTSESSMAFIMNFYIQKKNVGDYYGEWFGQGNDILMDCASRPYRTISTVEEWNALAAESHTDPVDDVYILTADLDGVTRMLGSTSCHFKGILLGAGHTVTANISSSASNDAGLIAYAEKAVILDLTVKGSVKGNTSVGGIVGAANDAVIGGCTSAVRVTGKVNVGGIVGNARYACRIEHCVYDWATNGSGLTAEGNSVGGIVGCTGNSTIEWCDNYADVKTNGSYVGGIVGLVQENTTIRTCCDYGSVYGKNDVGGIVGRSENSNIYEGCYSQAIVTATDDYAGGIIGKIRSWTNSDQSVANTSCVYNCINVGLVTCGNPNHLFGTVPDITDSMNRGVSNIRYPKEQYTRVLHTFDLTIPSTVAMIENGYLADFINSGIVNSDIESPT